ncbi:MAG: PEP-CTERM sorting domain-containing protein [Roseiarcus sp.]|uniref:PEP-CTERM sorting domain-containing protein n=1 Tax=Roseiarcus sp. TaxID=1969460 RepID=UPI003C69F9BC
MSAEATVKPLFGLIAAILVFTSERNLFTTWQWSGDWVRTKGGRAMRKLLAGVAFAATMALAGQVSAANLLVNGSFETGDFTGWTEGGNFSYTTVEPNSFGYGAEQGNYYVYEGPIGSDGTLSQTFSDMPGATLLISGWIAGNGTIPSDVNYIFDGVTVFTLNPVPSQGYVNYTATVRATGLDTFTVGFRNDPSFDALDNFSVTAVPEASTWAMMVLGFAGLGFAGFRARRTAVAAL